MSESSSTQKVTVDQSGRALGPRAMSTRQRLLDATVELLDEQSVRDIAVVDIARKAGTSPATFYQYFKDVAEASLRLAELPGLEIVDHADSETCCGSAGIYNLVHGDVAAEIGRVKVDSILASGAELVVTGNPGCMIQIQAHLRERGSKVRVAHPVELLLPAETP